MGQIWVGSFQDLVDLFKLFILPKFIAKELLKFIQIISY